MLKRIVTLVLGFVAAVALVSLAIANRHSVPLVLDPFRPENPALSLVLPFYAHLFAMLILGVLLGGAATWLSQAGWRRAARQRTSEVKRWRSEADRLTRERDAEITTRSKDLVPVARRDAA